MRQTVMALKLKKKINAVSKQNLVGAAVSMYELTPLSIQKQKWTSFTREEWLLDPLSFAVRPPSQSHCCTYRVTNSEAIHSFTLMVLPNHINRTGTSPYSVILFSRQDYFTVINNVRYVLFLFSQTFLLCFFPVRFCYSKSWHNEERNDPYHLRTANHCRVLVTVYHLLVYSCIPSASYKKHKS